MARQNWAAPLSTWRRVFADDDGELWPRLQGLYGDKAGAWRARLQAALITFSDTYPEEGDARHVVIARCPGQMNIAGMHIDYGGMPSLHLAVRGHDTVTIAAARDDDVVRLRSLCQDEDGVARSFEPAQFHLADLCPATPIDSRQALLDLAGHICARREQATGS
ncbi:MAG: hypothetical protein O2782_22490, partial [bacterium]|nr:hypothetical protein [bacterium]